MVGLIDYDMIGTLCDGCQFSAVMAITKIGLMSWLKEALLDYAVPGAYTVFP